MCQVRVEKKERIWENMGLKIAEAMNKPEQRRIL